MKKITFLMMLLLAISWQASAQFGCASGVVITDGFTQNAITTPGAAGAEDWNDNPTVTCGGTSNFYWDDDVYLFTYTAGANDEEISMTTFTRNSWNGLGIFTTCTGAALDGCLDTVGSSSSNISKTVTATITAGQTVYIAVGQWGTPNDLDFDVTAFTVTPIINPPNCDSVLTETVDVALSGDISWNAATGAATGYNLVVGTTMGGNDVLSLTDVGNVTTYNLGTLMAGTTYYATITPYNSIGSAIGCTEQTFVTVPPPPVNDDCSGATPYINDFTMLAEGACVGTPNTLSLTSATNDIGNDDPSCDSFSPNIGVWYTWTATSIGLRFTSGTGAPGLAVYEAGTCGSLVEVGCLNNSSGSITGLTVSNNYVLYIWDDTANTTVDFCLEEYTPPPPPANDDCSIPNVLTESTDFNCNNTVSGTTVSATASTEGCNSTNPDVWYTFVPTQTGDYFISVSETQDFGSSSTYVSIYTGSCAALTQVGSACFSSSTTQSLTMGTTYYINVRSTSSTEGVNFDLCAFLLPPAPSNDDCAAADVLTESTDSNCNNTVSGTTVSATASTEADCSTTNPDVWYTFTPAITGNYYLTAIETQDLGSNSTYVSLFEGSCGALTQVGTTCFENTILESLTSGTTYYVNVRSTSTTAGVYFDLCAFLEPAAPANTDCPGQALTPGAVFSSNPVDGTIISATADVEDVDTCGQPGNGVWYSVVVPGDGNITIETGPDSATGTTTFDSVIEAFSGTCGALTSIACDDDGAATANFSLLDLTGLTPGSTIYIRVWEYDDDEIEPFAISAFNATLTSSQFESPNAFKYFPNPANNTLSLRAQNTIQNVTVFNMLGQEVLRTSPNTISKDLDIAALQSGAYFVRVTINNTTQTIRIIKK